MIEAMVAAVGNDANERDKHIFREALRRLVSVAQTEQVLSIQRDFYTASLATSRNYKRSA